MYSQIRGFINDPYGGPILMKGEVFLGFFKSFQFYMFEKTLTDKVDLCVHGPGDGKDETFV